MITKKSKHPLYSLFYNMQKRVLSSKHVDYKYYGARNIKICDRWLGKDGFQNFLSDMGERPSLKHSIDRIDSKGDYTPSNCRWANLHQQNANRDYCNLTPGVTYRKSRNTYIVRIMINGVHHYFGSYKNYDDAVKARHDAEVKHQIYN
jgi:hypothetical protein